MKDITVLPLLATLLLLGALAGCKGQPQNKFPEDPHSFSEPNQVVVKHIDLDLKVNFEARQLDGLARLTIDNRTGGSELILDSRGLQIDRVTLDEDGTETRFDLGEEQAFLGQPLKIQVRPNTESITVYYQTSPAAAAIQWLTPEQTSGGAYPFLFTQSQAILARTWIPCQDSPGIRITYSATIRTDPALMALMSAENGNTKNAEGIYRFQMPQPIPPYLLALAVGDIEYRALGERSGVYAEPSVIDKAAFELEDTEEMIAAAEKLYGPYRWERYDIIVLPPSFPFGGMENPRLTFATPTILAGDKSLVALVAHELAHSWSGNLVTNATWDDFWLNEGFTTYFEHRIMEELYGADYAEMLASLSYQDWQKELDDIAPERPEDTHLYLQLAGRDPDEGMTAIAYDKGHYFLRTLERLVGRKRWDSFLRNYFDEFAFKTITSEAFVTYLKKNLLNDPELLRQAQVEAWVYGPGIPDNIARAESGEFAKVEAQINAFQGGVKPRDLQTGGWTTHHWLHFLRNLPEGLSKKEMASLDRAYKFSEKGNSEILTVWFLHVIASQYEPAYPAMENFLTAMGRRKFLKPLYEKMAEDPEMLQMAKLIYQKARPFYHSVATGTVDRILKWQPPEGTKAAAN